MRSSENLFKDKLLDAYTQQSNVKLNADTLGDVMKYSQAMEQEETKEATGASSAGAYSGPIFTKEESKEEKIKGGKSTGMSLQDLAKYHTKDKYAKTQNPERINKMYDHLRSQLNKGIKVEMEHTEDKEIAKEIAMDHLYEDPNYYNKLSKIHREGEKVEAKEATTSASSGSYETPAFVAPNKKNWRGGQKPLYKGGKFVKVKKKCLTFPYCNQGAGAVKMFENKSVQEAINSVSKKTGLSESYIKNILDKHLKKKNQ
jgi:hypothetical protein